MSLSLTVCHISEYLVNMEGRFFRAKGAGNETNISPQVLCSSVFSWIHAPYQVTHLQNLMDSSQ